MKKATFITTIPLLALLLLTGCVEREMTITSEPEGALVYVSNKEIGRTPLTQTFLWYGDYKIALRKRGYQTLKTHRDLNAPIYEKFPLDFFSQIAPWTIHDRRYLHFKLAEQDFPETDAEVQAANDALIQRADALRRKNAEPVKK